MVYGNQRVVSWELKAENGKNKAKNGKKKAENGERKIESEEWFNRKTGGGNRKTGGEVRDVQSGKLYIVAENQTDDNVRQGL